MIVYTFSPENRDAVVKRRVEQGALVPPGGKVVGEWASTAGQLVFRLLETDDPKVLMAATLGWSDLGSIESYAVLPMDDVLKIIQSRK